MPYTRRPDGSLEVAALFDSRSAMQKVQLLLPVDVICTYDLEADVTCCTRPLTVNCCSAEAPCIPHDAFGADIGPKSASLFSEGLKGCRTIFWNGPMGKFEMAAYAAGTEELAHSVAAAAKLGSVTIVGGALGSVWCRFCAEHAPVRCHDAPGSLFCAVPAPGASMLELFSRST